MPLPFYGGASEVSEYVVYEMCYGNYDRALDLINTYLHSCQNHSITLELLELKNIVLRLRIRTEGNMLIGPTKKSKVLPRSFTFEMLDVVQKVMRCKNHYEVLRVSRDATFSEVKRAYKRLALRLHPDKNHTPFAEDAFRKISDAADTLTDSKKRLEYNLYFRQMHEESKKNYENYYSYIDGAARTEDFKQNIEKYNADRETGTQWTDEVDNDWEQLYDEVQQQGHRRAYQPANQRVPQNATTHQSQQILLGVFVTALLMFIFSYVLQSSQVYSFEKSNLLPVHRVTCNLGVPYYVAKDFEKNKIAHNLPKLEQEIEGIYILNLRQTCQQEYGRPEIDELIEKLKSTSVSPDNDTTTLLSEISATKDPKLFDKHELADCFLSLAKSNDTNVRKEAAKCIAEITKSEVQRKKFTKRDIIKSFLECLQNVQRGESGDDDNSSLELPIQICRALGNICYLNDDARDIILELKGDNVLIQLLDVTKIHDDANALQFIKVRGGLLSNYLLGGEGLAKRAMELQIMQKLQNIITIGVTNVEHHEDLLLNTLPLLSILTENVADLNFDANLNIQLSRILAASTNPDLAEMCLELLHYQAESDDVKLLLAKDGLCETIYNLLEKYKTLASTSEARALMKLACELIVLILTGDESMHYLYTTPLLKNMEAWLDSVDIDLLTTGVLALGNFARTDSHCIYFVEQKTMNKLLDVLSKNNGVKDDVRLQHALLSALRNLVIPKANKNAVIQAGLVETILPMLEIHQPPVVFKLLGTLRMTVDGQENLALELLKNKTLIEQLVHWSKSSDYAGVTGESLRLMAWLIKHAYLSKIAYALPRKGDAPAEQLADKIPKAQDYDRSSLNEFVANEGTVEAMINMLTSQHLVMQNEALIAICILSVVYLANSNVTNIDAQRLQDLFIKYEVGKKLAELISKSSDTMTKEIVENLQNCINLLKATDKLIKHLELHNINELLKSIPILTEYCTL